MANQLTVGQRIDVYECVMNVLGSERELTAGVQRCEVLSPRHGMIELFITKHNRGEGNSEGRVCYPFEVKKTGTFIVKSLKGGADV